MRKNILSLSIAAMIGGLGFAGNALAITDLLTNPNNAAATSGQTLRVSGTGTGHILTVPYFTTQNNNMTLLNIVNSDSVNGKVLKVRFRSALNSDDIFDFQLYLSAADVWTAQVTAGAGGVSTLATKDNSCTLPANVNQAFVLDRLPGSGAAQAALSREGYVEILNVADVPPRTTTGTLSKAITHASGVPACAGLQNLGLDVDKSYSELLALGMTNPTGNLFANYSIVNVNSALAFSGEAIALVANQALAYSENPGTGALVWFPQMDTSVTANSATIGYSTSPNNIGQYTADPLLRLTGGAQFDLPDLSTPYTVTALASSGTPDRPAWQAFLLSSAMATTTIANEYLTDSSVVAATDWVFSMTTRRYNVAANYTASASARAVYTNYNYAYTTSQAIDLNFFSSANVSVDSSDTNKLCVSIDTGTKFYDRSETTTGSNFVISPGRAQSVKLCGETSVMSFNAGTAAVSVLGASVARSDATTAYTDGWARLFTSGIAGKGLPITGLAFVKAVNNAVSAGVSGNFGGTYEHRYSRSPVLFGLY